VVTEGSFLNEFLRLCSEKLAPTGTVGAQPILDLALFVPRREVGAYASLKKLASDTGKYGNKQKKSSA
jgi:hypothetical protein